MKASLVFRKEERFLCTYFLKNTTFKTITTAESAKIITVALSVFLEDPSFQETTAFFVKEKLFFVKRRADSQLPLFVV
jgi:hypothetical protein